MDRFPTPISGPPSRCFQLSTKEQPTWAKNINPPTVHGLTPTLARWHAHTHVVHADTRAHAHAKNENVIREGRESTQGDELNATLGYCLTPGSARTRNKYARVRSKWRKQHRSQGRRRWPELTTTGQDNAYCFEQLPPHAIPMPRDCHARQWRVDSSALTGPVKLPVHQSAGHTVSPSVGRSVSRQNTSLFPRLALTANTWTRTRRPYGQWEE